MRYRRLEFRPGLERLETKQPLSTATTTLALTPGPTGNASQLADNQDGLTVQGAGAIPAPQVTRIKLDRVTNPKGQNALFNPPFGHVLIQTTLPVPGQVYNILFISVYNGSGQTLTASDKITVRTSNTPVGQQFPILTGDQQWKPGGRIVFYVLSKKYYPFTPVVASGFQFNFVNPKSTAIPGPSGIALRVRYNPATFDQVLDHEVTSGPGAIGHQFGLPDTAIWALYPPTAKIIRV